MHMPVLEYRSGGSHTPSENGSSAFCRPYNLGVPLVVLDSYTEPGTAPCTQNSGRISISVFHPHQQYPCTVQNNPVLYSTKKLMRSLASENVDVNHR